MPLQKKKKKKQLGDLSENDRSQIMIDLLFLKNA